jgi:hypothetical protein
VEGVGADGGDGREGENGGIEVGDGRGRREVGSVEDREGGQRKIKANAPLGRPVGGLIIDLLLGRGGGGEVALAVATAVATFEGRKGGIIIASRSGHGGRYPTVNAARPPVDEPTASGHPIVEPGAPAESVGFEVGAFGLVSVGVGSSDATAECPSAAEVLMRHVVGPLGDLRDVGDLEVGGRASGELVPREVAPATRSKDNGSSVAPGRVALVVSVEGACGDETG